MKKVIFWNKFCENVIFLSKYHLGEKFLFTLYNSKNLLAYHIAGLLINKYLQSQLMYENDFGI